jgi:hypothetical protein
MFIRNTQLIERSETPSDSEGLNVGEMAISF